MFEQHQKSSRPMKAVHQVGAFISSQSYIDVSILLTDEYFELHRVRHISRHSFDIRRRSSSRSVLPLKSIGSIYIHKLSIY